MKNLKQRILNWLDLYDSEEVEKIVDFWTLQHKQASNKIDELNARLEKLKSEYLSMISYDPDKVVRLSGKGLKLGNYELTAQEIQRLQEEAGFLKQSELWKIFTNTLTELARQNMFEYGGVVNSNICDFHVGRATIYDIKAMKEILENIVKYRPQK